LPWQIGSCQSSCHGKNMLVWQYFQHLPWQLFSKKSQNNRKLILWHVLGAIVIFCIVICIFSVNNDNFLPWEYHGKLLPWQIYNATRKQTLTFKTIM
jgi:hypothetical protein